MLTSALRIGKSEGVLMLWVWCTEAPGQSQQHSYLYLHQHGLPCPDLVGRQLWVTEGLFPFLSIVPCWHLGCSQKMGVLVGCRSARGL